MRGGRGQAQSAAGENREESKSRGSNNVNNDSIGGESGANKDDSKSEGNNNGSGVQTSACVRVKAALKKGKRHEIDGRVLKGEQLDEQRGKQWRDGGAVEPERLGGAMIGTVT